MKIAKGGNSAAMVKLIAGRCAMVWLRCFVLGMTAAACQLWPGDEVNPVMSAVLSNGLEVTALHNHFFREQPRIFYMHLRADT